MISVSIIGSGRVAKHLHDAFSLNGEIDIVQVVSRNTTALQGFDQARSTTSDFKDIADSDIYIIAVSDNAINSVSQQLNTKNKLVVHTSGATPMDILATHPRHGVFYPLQSFSKDRPMDFNKVPLCLESNTQSDLDLLKQLAQKITGRIYEVSTEQRKTLHLAAVFVNNFTNHLYHLAHEICKEKELSFELLRPLIGETVDKLSHLTPYQAQTGPARRGDQSTIDTHLAQLKKPVEIEIYKLLSQSIENTYGKEL
ncbi:Rossmann-like and DUF2520 domain-containing protein [Pseudozobellia thermophila]|uniref:Predicted oxidoreductase, contains short-chain dehydrogenase (SDR) and DUF2520 domains n=1 Tax=Pseudozobellia thermophila TaxID=192903 RepID=A0A1M6LFV5_9FLAO|nr:Rossmann-like and DUF2520 domain-containing protein [Pseudozobellia thermophila]SHJ70089.1 Predicted oxidoreductase, contains short-chain dehydrogenase (SDR) and DUF2520 domains [Pseudozobellia thermophila]